MILPKRNVICYQRYVPADHSSPAWLELPDGRSVPIEGVCSIGRSSRNNVQLLPEDVSRCHATIHAQNAGEHWLVDLGSTCGTCVNDRRLVQPRRLSDGDRILIGGVEIVFRTILRPEPLDTVPTDPRSAQTGPRIGWLLLADIEGSARLSQQLSDSDLARLIGTWIRVCRDAVEENDGAINNYIGDAILAYWWHGDTIPARIAATLTALQPAQAKADPPFRLIVHFGSIVRGYGASHGAECLEGPTVIFPFRIEKIAARLREPVLLSSEAAEALGGAFPTRQLPGRHAVKSFDGRYTFFVPKS